MTDADTGVESDADSKDVPLRLNRRVNVLPQPGTGQTKLASLRRRLALAAWVALVVTCCFSTCMIGGSRGTFAPCVNEDAAAITEDERPRVVGAIPAWFPWIGGSCWDCA